MGWTRSSRARAKINLTLSVTGRKSNGYHTLESLVGFAASGDTVTLTASNRLSLTVTGPEARGLSDPASNHIIKAVSNLQTLVPGLQLGAFHLVKRLPLASGIGGGSADAAAALRLVAKLNGMSLGHPALREAALATGADVPVCLASRLRMMRGIGEALDVPLTFPTLFAVLVNPRVETATVSVFQKMGLARGEERPDPGHRPASEIIERSDAIDWIAAGRNDMEEAAIALVPEIAQVNDALAATGLCRLARMSGSGATVFGLFDTCREAARAAKQLIADHPGWWVRPTTIG